MGSFAASVDLPEHLRPWSSAGLDLLFLPDGLPVQPEASVQAVGQAPQTTTAPPAAPGDPAPTTWPAPWCTLAARVRTAPRVIITYAALADDVAGAADPARRKLFQSVLSYLAWPLGTTLFWPVGFPQGVDPGPHFASDIFAAGVRHFAIRHILCFGESVAKRARTLFPQEDKTAPVSVHGAPEPEALISMLPHELHQALAAIKGIALD